VPNIRIKFRNKTWLEEWLVLKGESEVMDSLIQFTTQNLLTSPISRKISLLPTIPDIECLPQTKLEELEGYMKEVPQPKAQKVPTPKLEETEPVVKSLVVSGATLPAYISGAVFGGIVAIALMDIFRRSAPK
jgi:hypothetical protein